MTGCVVDGVGSVDQLCRMLCERRAFLVSGEDFLGVGFVERYPVLILHMISANHDSKNLSVTL